MIGTRKRICRFCENGIVYIDYKDEKLLNRFTTENGKINGSPVPALVIREC